MTDCHYVEILLDCGQAWQVAIKKFLIQTAVNSNNPDSNSGNPDPNNSKLSIPERRYQQTRGYVLLNNPYIAWYGSLDSTIIQRFTNELYFCDSIFHTKIFRMKMIQNSHIKKAQQGGRYLCGNLGRMRKFREFGWKFLLSK